MEFIDVDDINIEIIDEYLKYQRSRICEFTRGTIMMWKSFYRLQYTIYDGFLIFKSILEDGAESFTVPLGSGDCGLALKAIENYTQERNIEFRFYAVTHVGMEILNNNYPGKFIYTELRDWFDYLYSKKDLMTLSGKRFHSKRNHVNRFKELYGEYEYRVIDNSNVNDIKALLDKHNSELTTYNRLRDYENRAVRELLENYSKYKLTGGAIFVKGQVAAFAIGEKLNDTLYVHVEKADRNFEGSYSVINMEFVRKNDDENIIYVNREEDVGDEGLRKAKLSYHPVELIRKNYAVPKQG